MTSTAFPRILPCDSSWQRFQGLFPAGGREFLIDFRLPGSGLEPKFSCDPQLYSLLQGYQNVVKHRLKMSTTADDFLLELTAIVKRIFQHTSHIEGLSPLVCTQIISEIDAIGWDAVQSLDASLTRLVLQTTDAASRVHSIQIDISPRFPIAPPTCLCALPQPFSFPWTPDARLQGLFKQFKAAVASYEPLWDMLAEIDANTWVLEPAAPSLACTLRRIALSSSASIQIEVDPRAPSSLPTCRVFGPDTIAHPLRQRLLNHASEWQPSRSLLTNLTTVLAVTFPSRPPPQEEDQSMECTICYCRLLDGAAPDVTCEQPQCAKVFHKACLLEWLQALPTTRRSFSTFFGECPYCATGLSVTAS